MMTRALAEAVAGLARQAASCIDFSKAWKPPKQSEEF
jgi:hypothetical protein